MRLIDANALKKEFCDYCSAMDTDMQTCDGNCDTLRIVDEQPTIEPEARHGRWIEKPPYADETVKELEFQIVCSRCDEQNASINFNDDGEIIGKTFYKTKFCPHCGAKMDGGADNG